MVRIAIKSLVFFATLVLATISTSNAFYTFVPPNKKIVYEYKAIIKGGTHYPASYASQFLLRGKLHLQTDGNGSFANLTNLTYQLYNGILGHEHEHEANDVLLPKEVEELQKVFKISYKTDGKTVGISTEANEKQYVRNIKNAIAGILQLDDTVKNHTKPYAFTTEEHSIYGYGEVNYNVVPYPDGNIEIHKLHNMIKTTHLYQYHQTNKDSLYCDIPYEDPILHDSQRKYVIASIDSYQIVKEIEAVGSILYYPHEANSDCQYLLVNQTFKLIQVVTVQEKFHVEESYFENHLTYHMFPQNFSAESTPSDSVADITLGRHVIDYEKLVPLVHEILEDMVRYLQEDHIHMKQPDIKRGQSINRIQNILMHFDSFHLEELHQSVSKSSKEKHKGTFEIWLHTLPIIGTRASAAIIKKLVVNQEVTDEVAVELLRQFPRHVLAPTKDLVTDMEWMSCYDGRWDVKKTAILAFASLISKAYKYSLLVNQNHQHSFTGYDDYVESHKDEHDLKEYYEKYVVEYVDAIKSTTDYKIQMVYMQALCNMKLESIIKYVHPEFTGSTSRHLRFLSLWVTGAVVRTPDQVYNILWPIVTSHKEYTEVRMAAYYLIIQSRPSTSMLLNIYWYMIHEPNEIFYNFHYTYVDSLMNRLSPCLHYFKLRLAQIKKYMHPPRHGSSSAYFADYQDSHYKFSGGSSVFFVNTNDTQLIEWVETLELSHRSYQNFVVMIKLYGHQIKISYDTMFKLSDLLELPEDKNWQIEIILCRNLHIYASYYFDYNNSDELFNFIKSFGRNQKQELNHQYLDISYDAYEKIAMPTDFGVPALFEILFPMVHKNNIRVTNEITTKSGNMHVENKYVEWTHHRQGLSFYNPVVDVWQGINRYLSHDKVLPLYFDVSLNMEEKILQLSWKKHYDARENIIGIRSHVLTMVFIKDDSHRKLLFQSSPYSKEWVIVTNEDNNRKNYTIYHNDNLNTGHSWQIAAYDSDHDVSNSFLRIHNHFTQPSTKNFNSVLSYCWVTFHHWMQYLYMMPKSGVYGVLIRGEPSYNHQVSNIDLSIHVNLEPINDTIYNPGGKLITRVTYAVKNREKSLKTWDFNAILDTNSGHTDNNLKIHLTRIVPGLSDYTICVEGDKKWVNNQVTGNLKVAKIESPGGKCFKNNTVIDVEMIGKKSYEQENELKVYGDCQYPIPYSVPRYHTLYCLVAHTSLRHYTYNVETFKVPKEFKKVFWQWWDYLKGHNMWHYSSYDEHHEDLGEDNLVLDIVYPMEGKTVNASLTTADHKYELTELPLHHWQWFEMSPDSTMYSTFFIYGHWLGLLNYCYVHFDHYRVNHHHVSRLVPNNWTLYLGSDSTSNPPHDVYVKNVQDKEIGLKVAYDFHTLEVVPEEDGTTFKITKDGKDSLSLDFEHYEDWVSYHMLNHGNPRSLLIFLPKSGLHLIYDGHQMVLMAPKHQHHWHGECWDS